MLLLIRPATKAGRATVMARARSEMLRLLVRVRRHWSAGRGQARVGMRGEIRVHVFGDDDFSPHDRPVAGEGADVVVFAFAVRRRPFPPENRRDARIARPVESIQ